MSERNPEARDRFRGMRLRAIRTQRLGLGLKQAADSVGWHGSKLSRTERGLRAVTIQDFAMLLTAWDLPADERDQILEELAQGSSSGWWDRPISGVPIDVGTLAAYEAEANGLVNVAVAAVPGLLHTRETAAAVMAADGVPPEDVDRRWMARLQRQQILTRIEYTTYIAESAVRTPWGGPEVWRAQLGHLLRCDELGLAQIRIIPHTQTSVLLLNTWLWMRFPQTPPVVHVELGSGVTYIHEADWYTEVLERLDRVAVPRDGTRKLIRELMEG
ncbi:MAG: helix-turn-helix transcriptional regulator [Actinophytocola sp.]|uniref:helix-turn-helix domain-containing protein n=1 Tax=Actinophytocola sp. TaxID=1872138 RepID=UPI003C735ED3